MKEHMDLSILSLKIDKENERGPKFMEAALSSLNETFKNQQLILSLEIAVKEKFLYFYTVVPGNYEDLIGGQLLSQFPLLDIEIIDDYAKVFSGKQFAATELFPAKSDLYPIQTYPYFETDPLTHISGVFAGFAKDESAWIQVLLRPVNKDYLSFKFKRFLKSNLRRNLMRRSLNYQKVLDEEEFKKASKPLFVAKIRLICFAADVNKAKINLQALISQFKHFSKPDLNSLKDGKILSDAKFLNEYGARQFIGKTFVLNSEELASIYHFPHKGARVAQVVGIKAKRAEPPPNLPIEETVGGEALSLFGETTFRNERTRFGIQRVDRSRHVYSIGKTGMGKTKLLELLTLEDLRDGKGVAVLDPHGDLAEELLRYVPKNRIYDTIYFNPADSGYPIGFNPIEAVETFEFKQNVVAGFIGIFKKLFGWNWNQRLEHVLRYTTLALLDYPNSTVLGIPRMLTDNLFRQEVIAQIQDPLVKKFWTTEFSSWSDQFSNEAIVPVINKVGQFVASPLMRNIVGQPKSVMNLGEIMNDEKILICNLSAGNLGEENSALLGSMLITKIWQAALERASMPEHERKDFYLYVDEFQNFATSAFANILSEARKYRLCLTIAHQYMRQLPEEVQSTIFGNVGSIVSFRVGGEDGAILEKEFTPVFSAADLMNLDMREIYLKIAIDGQTVPPFSAKTITLPKADEDYSEDIIDFSRRKWAKPRKEIEKEIEEFEEKEFRGKLEEVKSKEEKKEEFSEPII